MEKYKIVVFTCINRDAKLKILLCIKLTNNVACYTDNTVYVCDITMHSKVLLLGYFTRSFEIFVDFCQDAKRAHHNALERKRRDHIKESFLSLRNAVPHLQNGRSGRSTSVG